MRGLSDRLIAGYLDDLVRAIRTIFSAAWEAHAEFHFWRGAAAAFAVMVVAHSTAVSFALVLVLALRRWRNPR